MGPIPKENISNHFTIVLHLNHFEQRREYFALEARRAETEPQCVRKRTFGLKFAIRTRAIEGVVELLRDGHRERCVCLYSV